MHIYLSIKSSFIRDERSIPNKRYKLTKVKHQSKPEIILKAQIIKKIKIQNQNTAPPNQTKTVMQSNKK